MIKKLKKKILCVRMHFNVMFLCPCVSDSGRVEDALKASQLCLQLLDASSRNELRRLLTFMAEAADPKAFQLHKTVPFGYQFPKMNSVCLEFITVLI